MTQAERFALRLKQVLAEPGLHEIVVHVNADRTISFWVVTSRKVEGETKSAIMVETAVPSELPKNITA